MTRKDIIISIFMIALGISLISNVVLLSIYSQNPSSIQLRYSTLVIAIPKGPDNLEIVDCWDDTSHKILDQVVETLFTNDLRDPTLPRINLLAESYWWENSTKLHIKLREGIIFHDGTPFNANAAKWNLDRLQYLINATGTNTGDVAQTRELWLRPDKKTPIINKTTTLEEYNLTITLNGPYSPFLNTLTLINAGMISPTSHVSNANTFLSLNDKPIGTGPFIFDHYTSELEVVLSRWNEYWNQVAYFQQLQYKIFAYPSSAQDQFQRGEVDINFCLISQTIPYYEGDPNFTVKRFTQDTGIPRLNYVYLGINNNKYNATWRKIFSYAINYTYIIKDLLLSKAIRANSVISHAYGNAYNSSIINVIPPDTGNITIARQIMVNMGFGDMGWTDQQWIAIAEGSTPFNTINYDYNLGNVFREDLGIALEGWLKLIGINLELQGWGASYYLDYLIFEQPENLGLFCYYWYPDYFDPYSMFGPLFNPNSISNSAKVNDTHLNAMVSSALETINDTARNIHYKNIQGYIAERGIFHIPLYHSEIYFVHSSEIRGYPYNAMEKFQAHGIWRI
jgi:peptide/nickel transport system substrate-binding protein